MPSKPVPANRAGRAPGQKNRYSSLTISRAIREALHTSLYVGTTPEKYMVELRKKRPDLFVALLGKCIKDDDGSSAGLVINVTNLVSPAVPTPGVLSSMLPEHIAPRAHLQLVEMVDAKASGDE